MQDEFAKLFDGVEADLDYEAPGDVKETLREELRAALEQAIEDTSSIDEMWSVFRDHLTDALLESSIVQEPLQSARTQLVAHLWAHERGTLIERAAAHLANRNHAGVVSAAANLLLSQSETRQLIERKAIELIAQELRPKVREQLVAELKNDPAVMDEVKRELKRKLLDI
jgi:hypothetical protein